MFLSRRAHVLDNPTKKERRSWNRILVQKQVFCQDIQGEDELCWSARATDISRGGIGLLSPHKFNPATIIRIGKADGFQESSRLVQALVIRALRSSGEKWILGCAFNKELSEGELLAWVKETAESKGCQIPPMLKPEVSTNGNTHDDDSWMIPLQKT